MGAQLGLWGPVPKPLVYKVWVQPTIPSFLVETHVSGLAIRSPSD
jgi:hypothetical protein